MTDTSTRATVCESVDRLMQAEDWGGAIELLGRHLELVTDDAELSWNLGWAFFRQGRANEALGPLRRAAELNPDDASTQWALGVILSEVGERADAERHFVRALSLRDTGMARLFLANLYAEQGRIDEAEAVHLEGLRLQPEHGERHEAYANFLSDMGREEESERERGLAETLPSREERKRRAKLRT